MIPLQKIHKKIGEKRESLFPMMCEREMKNEGFERGACEIWIDHLKQIVSFREGEGFEVLAFSTPEERLAYAFEKCSNGYRVQ